MGSFTHKGPAQKVRRPNKLGGLSMQMLKQYNRKLLQEHVRETGSNVVQGSDLIIRRPLKTDRYSAPFSRILRTELSNDSNFYLNQSVGSS